FDVYPEEIKSYLMHYADTDEKKQDVLEQMPFNPLTSRIAAIGMMDHFEKNGCVLVNCDESNPLQKNHNGFNYVACDENKILKTFWDTIVAKGYNMFVTFNGREFDCPFIMLRSSFLKIRPGFNLMDGSDFNFRNYHIDLLKEFTFFTHSGRGARRKFSLDFYCRKFGIQSPKKDGVSGEMVGKLVSESRFQELADYCLNDVIAENELFNYWNEYFNI
ncbi:MAG: ribonuclease H-like domain-containing protein, partial [Ignavibacteria bacterium]